VVGTNPACKSESYRSSAFAIHLEAWRATCASIEWQLALCRGFSLRHLHGGGGARLYTTSAVRYAWMVELMDITIADGDDFAAGTSLQTLLLKAYHASLHGHPAITTTSICHREQFALSSTIKHSLQSNSSTHAPSPPPPTPPHHSCSSPQPQHPPHAPASART